MIHIDTYLVWDESDTKPPMVCVEKQTVIDAMQDMDRPNVRTQYLTPPRKTAEAIHKFVERDLEVADE